MVQVLVERTLVVGNGLHVGMELTHVDGMVVTVLSVAVSLVVFVGIVVAVVVIAG